MKIPLRIAVLALPLLLAGCVAPHGSAEVGEMRPTRDRTVLTQAEIEDAHVQDAYEAVRQLRPGWLRRRGARGLGGGSGSDIVIYMDNVPQHGGPEVLRGVPASAVVRMEYVDASTATQRWGTNHVYGAIVVQTM